MEIETRIVKNGNSYAMAIPKALVNCKILKFGKPYVIKIEEPQSESEMLPQYTKQSHIYNYSRENNLFFAEAY